MVKRPNGFVYPRKGSPNLWIGYRRGGKLIRESSGTADYRKAEDLLRQRQQMVLSGTIDTLRTTVDDLYELVRQDYRLKGRASLDDVEARWKHHLQPFFSGLLAHEVKSDLISFYKERRLQEKAKHATINREISIIRRGYKLGLKAKRVLHDHVPSVETLTEDNIRKGFVEPQQYAKLVAEFNKVGLWMRSLFECAYVWGFRRGELVISEGKGGLRVRQVDFTERLVRLEVGETKNGEGREVPMTETIYQLLKACCEGKKPEDYVFTRTRGRKKQVCPVRHFRRTWLTAVKAAGMPNLLLHDLRRSAIRVMVRSGINQNVAMSISGHKTASVFQRYNIVDSEDKRKAMQQREDYLRSVNEKSACRERSQSAHNEAGKDAGDATTEERKLLN